MLSTIDIQIKNILKKNSRAFLCKKLEEKIGFFALLSVVETNQK